MADVYSPEYLYTSDKLPVQFGSIYEIKRYLKRAEPAGLKGYLRDLEEYAKRIQLGTLQGVAHRKEGIATPSILIRMNFSYVI